MDTEYVAPEIQPLYYAGFVDGMPSMSGKTVAITGSTSGTGLIAAKTIAAKGARVLLLNRASERSAAAEKAVKEACRDGGTAQSIDCNLQDFASVREAAAAVDQVAGESGLYALVNNAGVMTLNEEATKDGFDVQMQTNHLSHFLLTALLMPALKRAASTAGEARIVNHSSAARHSPNTPLEEKYFQQKVGELGGDDARYERYHQTKLANSTFTYALQGKLTEAGSNIKALCAHPGVCPTSLASTTVANTASGGAMLMNIVSQGHAAEDGTLPLLSCICNVDAESGDFYGPWTDEEGVMTMGTDKVKGPPTKLNGPEELSRDPTGQKLLWDASEAAVGETLIV